MTSQPGPTLLAAQRLVACGVNVIPLRTRDKRPAVTTWKQMQSVRLVEHDWDEVDRYLYRWWGNGAEHGLGVVTGAVSEILVVDVDDDHARELVERTCGWPRTVSVKTHKGWHLWFAYPGTTRNGVRRGDAALDVRADGGYVVAPPSVHPSGHVYAWEVSPWTFSDGMWPPAAMPDELRTLLWPERPERPVTRVETSNGGTKYAQAALDREVAEVRAAPVGRRNDTLNRGVFAVWRFVIEGQLDAEVVVREFAYAARACGLEDREAQVTIESAIAGRHG